MSRINEQVAKYKLRSKYKTISGQSINQVMQMHKIWAEQI